MGENQAAFKLSLGLHTCARVAMPINVFTKSKQVNVTKRVWGKKKKHVTCTVLALGTFSFSAGFMSVKKPIVLDTANLFGFEAAYPFPALDFDGLIKLMDFLGCALALLYKERKI
jgi:hypothetical protein